MDPQKYMRNREFVTIRGRQVRHSTACRDYVCGVCGSALVTRYLSGAWATVCAGDQGHSPSRFVHQMTWARRQARLQELAAEEEAHAPVLGV